MALEEDVLVLLAHEGMPLDDDQIAQRLGTNRHYVNAVCRRLATSGRLIRQRGPAGKLVNFPRGVLNPRDVPGSRSVGQGRLSTTEAKRLTELSLEDIEANLKRYLADREDIARYASFDYCFNYFRSFYAEGRLGELASADYYLQLSCLQLGFYLASWGMFRGRSQLLQRSVKHYVPVLKAIAGADRRLWEIDVDGYDGEAIGLILSGAQEIRNSFPHPARDVLVTKIMLGVFGCVPAFDRYFKDGFGSQTFGTKALRRIGAFYERRSGVIDRYRVPTIDFNSGGDSSIRYTGAKVIDMIFFIEGVKKGAAPGE